MKQTDDMELVESLGLSRELTEFSWTECRILNDHEYMWAIQLHPPIERDDVMYFKIYNNATPGIVPMFNSTKCARISLLSPEYIHCSDCSKEEWILNEDEKNHLCKILDDFYWRVLVMQYQDQLEAYDGRQLNLYSFCDDKIITNIPKPNYMLLPNKEG